MRHKADVIMEWIAHPDRFGWLLFSYVVLAGVYGAADQIFRPQPNGDGVALPFAPLFFMSLVALVYVFVKAGRSGGSGLPTMSQLAFGYMVSLAVIAVALRGIDFAPWLPSPPDVLLHAVRTALYASAIPTAWVFLFGKWRGWNRRRVNPGPVAKIYGRAPAELKGEDEDG